MLIKRHKMKLAKKWLVLFWKVAEKSPGGREETPRSTWSTLQTNKNKTKQIPREAAVSYNSTLSILNKRDLVSKTLIAWQFGLASLQRQYKDILQTANGRI